MPRIHTQPLNGWWLFAIAIVVYGVSAASRSAEAEPPIVSLAISTAETPRRVLAGSQAGVHLYELDSLERQSTIAESMGTVHDVSFSPDGRWLALAGGLPAEIGRLQIYAWPSLRMVAETAITDDVIYAVAWHPNSRRIGAACHDARVAVIHVVVDGGSPTDDAAISLRVSMLPGHSRAARAVEYADASTLVTASADRSLRVWVGDVARPVRVLDQHTDEVVDLAVRPAQNAQLRPMLASISADRTVRIWQPTIGRLVRFARLDVQPLSVCWTGDGKWIVAACTDGAIYTIDPQTAKLGQRWNVLPGWAYAVAAIGEQQVIVGGTHGKLRRIDLAVPPPAGSPLFD